MKYFCVVVIILAGYVMASISFAQGSMPVDWLHGYVTVAAKGYAKATGSPADTDNAIEAAKVVAQADLLEAIRGVHIDSQTALSDLMEEKRETAVRVQGVLRNAFLIGEPKITEANGYVTAVVEMRVCLFPNGDGCKSGNNLTDMLPSNHNVKKAAGGEACKLVPNLTDNQELIRKGLLANSELPELIAISLQGKPINTENRDFILGFLGYDGSNCIFYTPNKVDPAVRRDRGTAEIHINGQSLFDHQKVLRLTAKDTGANNHISVERLDAYLIQIFNNSSNNLIYTKGKFAVVLADY